MANKFLYDQKDIQANEFVQPYIQPTKPHVSTLASDAASLAKTAVSDYQTQELAEDLQTESDKFLGKNVDNPDMIDSTTSTEEWFMSETSDNDSHTEQEQRHLREAGRSADKLRKLQDQGRLSPDAFRAKTEAMLKGYINQTPGLTQELRAIAAATLGFDPTGAELKAALAAGDASTASTASRIKLMATELQQKGHLYDTGLSDAGNVAKYWDVYQTRVLRQGLLADGRAELENIEAVTQIEELQMMRKSVSGDLMSTMSFVDGIVAAPATTEEEKAGQIERLEKLLVTNDAVYAANFGQNVDKIPTLFQSSRDWIQTNIDHLKGDINKELYQNKWEMVQAMNKLDLHSDPTISRFITMISSLGGLQGLRTEDRIFVAKNLSYALRSLGSPDPDKALQQHMSADGISQAEIDRMKEKLPEMVANVWKRNKINMPPEEERAIYDTHVAYTRNIRGYPGEIRTGVMDSIFELGLDKDYARVVHGQGADKTLYDNLKLGAMEYVPRVFSSLRADIADSAYNPADFNVQISATGKLRFVVNDKGFVPKDKPSVTGRKPPNAALDLGAKPDFSGSALAEPIRKARELKAAELNNLYGNRLNNVVASMSHLDNHTDYTYTAVQILGKGLMGVMGNSLSPELLKLLNPDDPDTISGSVPKQ